MRKLKVCMLIAFLLATTVVRITFQRAKFGIGEENFPAWLWRALLPSGKTEIGYDFATCQDAYNGYMGSATRLWIESKGWEWVIETDCEGTS